MEPTHDLAASPVSNAPSPNVAELVVQNGRLSGARRALTPPVTLLGRADGCDIRLNVEGVNPLHCTISHTPAGLLLQDLRSASGTLVNGEAVSLCVLADGDLITVGPFRFRVHLPEPALDAYPLLSSEKEALRIQASAVAAQQSALTEEELRLQQRRLALEQQEEQLSVHLEDKRCRLVKLRDDARKNHATLKAERSAYEQRVAEVTRNLLTSRKELADGFKELQAERQHLLELRQRLKRRFHRQWQAERDQLRRREEELNAERRLLDKEREQLEQEHLTLSQTRLRYNGDMELGRRQLQADRDELHRQQRQWLENQVREQAELQNLKNSLEQRDQALTATERHQAEQQRHLETRRTHLERDAEGLENRVRSLRQKLVELQQEQARLETAIRPPEAIPAATPAASQAPSVPMPLELESLRFRLQERETDLQHRLTELETMSAELADQRVLLAEQCERLVQARAEWDQERQSAVTDLQGLGGRLEDQARLLTQREESLIAAESSLRQRSDEITRLQNQLEAWRARLTTQAASWDGERDRLLATLQQREQTVGQQETTLAASRQRWDERRRRFLTRLRRDRATCEELRQEWAALRLECWQRRTHLEQEERKLAEKTLVLEQYHQEFVVQSGNPRVAEKRMERLRRRWAALNVTAERNLMKERVTLERELARLEERSRHLHLEAESVAALRAELAEKQAAWELQSQETQREQEKTQQYLRSLLTQRDCYEQQVEKLRDEVERLARMLYDDTPGTALPPVGQAA